MFFDDQCDVFLHLARPWSHERVLSGLVNADDDIGQDDYEKLYWIINLMTEWDVDETSKKIIID